MACIYMLALRCKSDDTRYYKIGYLSNGNAPDRMNYCDNSNVPLTTYFDLLDYRQWETPKALEIEQHIHNMIRNEWKWKCDGALGIHRKHKFFPQLFSGVTEVRVYDSDEVKAVYRCIKEALGV